MARALEAHPSIERVHYPGLADDPGNAVARRLFPEGQFGAVLAFAIRDVDKQSVMRFLERLQLIRAAPTLGDCFSLVLYPVIASHRGLTPDQRAARGIHDNVVRFSAGLEDAADASPISSRPYRRRKRLWFGRLPVQGSGRRAPPWPPPPDGDARVIHVERADVVIVPSVEVPGEPSLG